MHLKIVLKFDALYILPEANKFKSKTKGSFSIKKIKSTKQSQHGGFQTNVRQFSFQKICILLISFFSKINTKIQTLMAISIAPINSRHFEVFKILGPIFSTQGHIKNETVNRENQGQTYIPTAVCVYIIGLQKTDLEVVQHCKQEINKIEKKLRIDQSNPTKNFDFELLAITFKTKYNTEILYP